MGQQEEKEAVGAQPVEPAVAAEAAQGEFVEDFDCCSDP